jgi:hypothetical protein
MKPIVDDKSSLHSLRGIQPQNPVNECNRLITSTDFDFRFARHPTGNRQDFRPDHLATRKVGIAAAVSIATLFRSRLFVLGCERRNPRSRRHSESLPEKFDKGTRLAIAKHRRQPFLQNALQPALYSFH